VSLIITWELVTIYNMKIGILTNTYPPNLNGVSVAVRNLEVALKAKGVEVFIATPMVRGVQYPANVLPLKAIRTKNQVSPDLSIPYDYIDDVISFFRENQVELVHTHDIFIGAAEGIVVATKLGVPSIHTFHTFVESYPYLQVPARKEIIRTHIRLVCNNYNHITAPSMKVYRYLAQVGFETPVTQLLNVPSVDYLKVKPRNNTFAKKYGIQKDDFVFVTFCRVAAEKTVDIGLVVLHQLLKKYDNIKYLICGQGPEIDELQALAKHLGIQDKVIFTGKYQPQDLSDIGSVSDVFVFTSHTENLPTNLFEAMSLGLPVLSVDDESVDYLLVDGQNGYKSSVDEMTRQAEELYLNSDLKKQMSQSALASVQKILEQDIAQEYIDLYTRVIKYYHEVPITSRDLENVFNQVQSIPKMVRGALKKLWG
jgi:1,2-diacylglycerol 3-alpha-glucosyltransferase